MFQWLWDRIPKRERLRQRAPHLEALAIHGPNFPIASSEDSAVYQQSPWVYLAINRIAEAAALVPLRVWRLLPGREEALTTHPLLDLLAAPNPTLSRFELMEQTVGMLELTGNAYWLLLGDEGGAPREIWPLHPRRVRIVPHPQRFVAGYIYEQGGEMLALDAREVVHFRRWHPGDDYYGLSPLAAARQAIRSERAMAEWNQGAFGEDKGVPAGIVNIKGPVTEADFERLKREWRASYGGARRRTAFLRAEDISWQHIGLSHNELDYLQGRQAQRDEILNLFGIPIGLISENATEANAKVAERQFIERTLWPKLVRIAQKLTQQLLPFYAGRARAEFADIRPTDTEARLREIRTAYPVLSVNEIREQYYQLSPVAWGERPVGRAADDDEPAPARRPSTTATQPSPTTAPERAAAPGKDAALRELRQWERFARRRGVSGQGRSFSARAFSARALPAEIACEVSARLLLAEDEPARREIFAAARQQLREGAAAHTSAVIAHQSNQPALSE